MSTDHATGTESGFAGRTAMVTGGSRGLGAATAKLLAAHGARVGVGGRDEEAVRRVVADIRDHGGEAVEAPADATDPDALAAAFDHVQRTFGPVELLAAFAGGNGRPQPAEQITPQKWAEVIAGDLTSTFLTIQAALPAMLAQRRGSIVTMSSSAGRQPSPASAAYAAAKAGVIGLSKHLAAELGPRGIRVNCLAPASVVNEKMAAHLTAQQEQAMVARIPLGRLGQPDDVARAAVHLLSDHASWLTGVTLDVTGGMIIT